MALTLFFTITCLIGALKAEHKTIFMYQKFLKGTMRGVLAMLLTVLVACSEQQELLSGDGEEIVTSVSVKVPDTFKSRSVAGYPADATSYLGESGYPSIGNIDLSTHPLTFTVGVYVEKTVGGNTEYTLVDKQYKKNVSDDKADFNFRLMKGQSYRIVAYADFSGNEQEKLDEISITPGLNEELKDAFFTTQTFVASENMSVVLKRPFGKLRLIARDFSTFAKGDLLKIENIKVTYGETAIALATNQFNAITGKFNNITEGVVREFTAAPVIYAKEHEGATVPYAAVFTMYLPVNFGTEDTSGEYLPVETGTPVPQSWMYPFNIELTYKNESGQTFTVERSFNFDVPIKRNWLTTIDSQDFWTDNSNITVSIDHRFEGFINKQPTEELVNSYTELRNAFDKIQRLPEKKGIIKLGNNIDATSKSRIWIGYTSDYIEGVEIHLDLAGHKIYQRNEEGYNEGLFYICRNNTLIIDDSSEDGTGTMEFPYVKNNIIQISSYGSNGGNVVINGGKFVISGDNCVVYSTDRPSDHQAGKTPTTITINGGWFENISNNPAYDKYLINVQNHVIDGNNEVYGRVYVNGGSFVGFNPAEGDNIVGNVPESWIGDDHIVVTETYNGRNLYTVIPKTSPE